MNISTPCICGCGELVDQPATGRAKKYLNDSHRVAHFNRNKAALTAIQSNPAPPPPAPSSPQNPLIINGIDYENPWKHLPPSIAAYLPIQAPGDKERLLALEARINTKPAPKSVTKDFPL